MAQRILRDTSATVYFQLLDQYGEPRAKSGNLTVTVTRASGTTINLGSQEPVEITDPIVYSIDLTKSQTADLDLLELHAADDDGEVTIDVEIVGGYYFTVYKARDYTKSLAKDTIKYSDELIRMVRTEVEDECYRITGRSFVPRFYKQTLSGNGSDRLRLRDTDVRNVRWLKIFDTTYAAGGFQVTQNGEIALGAPTSFTGDSDMTFARFPVGVDNIEVGYEYGANAAPEDLQRANLVRLRSLLNQDLSGINSRATSWTDGISTYSLWTAGARGAKTDIPFVDATYERYGRDNNPFERDEFTGSVALS